MAERLTLHVWTLQAFINYTSLVDQGLQNKVTYRVWLIAKDSLGNVQTALSSVTLTTVRTTPPSFEELLVEYNAPTSVYVEVCRCVCHPAHLWNAKTMLSAHWGIVPVKVWLVVGHPGAQRQGVVTAGMCLGLSFLFHRKRQELVMALLFLEGVCNASYSLG